MNKRRRRFEVLLPLQFNDGRAVPKSWLADAIFEIAEHFDGASHDTQEIEGFWRHAGEVYHEKFSRVVVDVPDTKVNREWVRQYKSRWKAKLKQIELWVISYRIEIE
ncbi:MAG TPA: hypothetical protein VGX70_07295 [Gemmataceae bacterium]|jgi:hypothetical protein|nr:hypothetical protein [Gemmataceae bacterium]